MLLSSEMTRQIHSFSICLLHGRYARLFSLGSHRSWLDEPSSLSWPLSCKACLPCCSTRPLPTQWGSLLCHLFSCLIKSQVLSLAAQSPPRPLLLFSFSFSLPPLHSLGTDPHPRNVSSSSYLKVFVLGFPRLLLSLHSISSPQQGFNPPKGNFTSWPKAYNTFQPGNVLRDSLQVREENSSHC